MRNKKKKIEILDELIQLNVETLTNICDGLSIRSKSAIYSLFLANINENLANDCLSQIKNIDNGIFDQEIESMIYFESIKSTIK